MTRNPAIVDAEQLRQLSGKHNRSAIRRWASQQGIRVLDGDNGPWTTIDALNQGLGVSSANEEPYDPAKVL